jgi:hypothetical protein
LWHHQQLKGHPLRNTVVRMPGPSRVENLMMSYTVPVIIAVALSLFAPVAIKM